MTINKTQEGTKLTLALEGRLDTMTAPSLEAVTSNELEGITELILDMSQLEYLSSAGLRVILAAQKKMNLQGKMIVKNVNEIIMEVFEVTGFLDIITVEA